MRLLIFGASGRTGQQLVQRAVEAGHSVTAFVRRPAALSAKGAALRIVQGKVEDAGAVSAAMPGHEAVVSVLGVGVPFDHDPAVIEGVGHIIRAMREHGLRRLIYLSFIGVRESRAAVGPILRFIAPLPLRHEIADHEAKEALVRASDLDWTIVRPPKLTDGPLTAEYRVGEFISTWKPVPLLARADVAHFILRELATPSYIRQAPRLLR